MGKKLLVFFEKYVEWVAVGVGGLWLIYMLLGYVLGTPVKVQIGSNEATPGTVDRRIVETAVNALDAKIQASKVPSMVVKPFGDLFVDAISFKGLTVQQIGTPPLFWTIAPSMLADAGPGREEQIPRAIAIPTAVAAVYDAMSTGRSVVDLGAAPADGAPAGGAPAGGTGNADRDWVSVSFKIPTAGLKASFEAAKVPQFLGSMFLSVDLVRQEKLADDTWGKEQVVGPLAIYQVPPLPLKGAPGEQLAYEKWAVDHVETLLQPPFYTIRATDGGDAWHEPGYVAPVAPGVAPVAPEQPPVVAPPRERPPRPTRPLGGPGQPGFPGAPSGPNRRPKGPPGEGVFPAPYDSDRPATPYGQAMPRRPIPGPGRPSEEFPPEGAGMPFPGRGVSGRPVGVPPVEGAAPAPDALPQGQFRVMTLPPTVHLWAHDDTVVPEHTYRYKVRYSIRNPLFLRPDSAVKPELTQVWAIASPDSNWSSEVKIPARAYFFLTTGGAINSPVAKFKIFKWQDGVWKTITDSVGPGDQVGKTINGVDFGTGWTVVDVRKDPQKSSQSYTLLINDRGELVRRTADADGADPKQKELNDLTNPAGASAQPVGAPFAGRAP